MTILQSGINLLDSAAKDPKTKLETLGRWAGDRVPPLQWLPSYDWKTMLKGDVVGGVTIGLIMVCQSMAHASIATTSLIQGPYCCFVPSLVYAIFGTSLHSSVGSGSMAAILIANEVQDIDDIHERTKAASLLAVIVGCWLMVMGGCGLSFITRFLSQPTLSGFTTGAGIIITAKQVKNLLGLELPRTGGFLDTVWTTLRYLKEVNVCAAVLGLSLMLMLDYLKKAKAVYKKDPRPVARFMLQLADMKELLVVVLSILAAYLTSSNRSGEDGIVSVETAVPVVGMIPSGLPPFALPWADFDFEFVKKKFWVSAMIAFGTFVTTYSACSRVAFRVGYRVQPSQEMFALGIAGAAGGFFGGFPVSGSLSRTGLAQMVGVQTQLGGVFAACVVGVTLAVLSPVLYFLPSTALGALVITSSIGLTDFPFLKWLWSTSTDDAAGGFRRDVYIWIVAFVFTLGFGVIMGIFCAVSLSMVLLIHSAVVPEMVELGRMHKGLWRDVSYWKEGAQTYPGVLVVSLHGPMFFANFEYIKEQLEKLEEKALAKDMPVEVVVLQMGSCHMIDATAITSLRELLLGWKKRGVHCIMCGSLGQARAALERHLNDVLNQSTFCIGTEEAVQKARRLVKRRKGTEHFDLKHEDAALKLQRRFRRVSLKWQPTMVGGSGPAFGRSATLPNL